jgi:hypothetical protein
MADADDEFARFERELRALEAAAPADDEAPAETAAEPVIAPAPPPASRAAPAARAVAATIARPAVAPAPGPASLPPPPPPPPPNAMLAGFYSAHVRARASSARALLAAARQRAACTRCKHGASMR